MVFGEGLYILAYRRGGALLVGFGALDGVMHVVLNKIQPLKIKIIRR
jgi:hypothetical protein